MSIGNIKPLFTGPLCTAHLPVPPSSPPVPTPRSREPAPAALARQRPTSPAGSRPALQAQTGWGPGDGQPPPPRQLGNLLSGLYGLSSVCWPHLLHDLPLPEFLA